MAEVSITALLAELEAHAHGNKLAQLVGDVARRVAGAKSRDIPAISRSVIPSCGLSLPDAETSHGNVLNALDRGPRDRAEQRLLSTLFARAIVLSPPAGLEAEDRLAAEMLWLAGHSPIDAFSALEQAMGAKSKGLWGATCDLVRRIDAGKEPPLDRADALVGAAALSRVTMSEVKAACSQLAEEVSDDALRSILRGESTVAQKPAEQLPPIVGEMKPTPRGAFVSALLLLTLITPLSRFFRAIGALALAYKAPGEITIDDKAIRIKARSEILGKQLRQAEHVIPLAQLVRATREVKFPKLGLYIGLLALVIGSYIGVALFVDGVRAASPSLLAQGLIVVAIGVAIELGLSSLFPSAKGRCHLVFVPRTGPAICVGDVDIEAADRTLARLVRKPG